MFQKCQLEDTSPKFSCFTTANSPSTIPSRSNSLAGNIFLYMVFPDLVITSHKLAPESKSWKTII